MDNESTNKGPKDAVLEHLKRNARELSYRSDMSSFCLENGIDERDAWEYLSEAEIDDEHKAEIQERCKRSAVLFIRASDMIEDGPIPGMTIDQVRGLFQVITAIGDEVRGEHVGRLRPGTAIHLQDRGIRPDMVNEISEALSRLCRHIKHRIPWELFGYVPAPDDPSSIMAPISPDDHVEAWISEHDPGVNLETQPGRYEHVMCDVIFTESVLFDSWMIISKDRDRRSIDTVQDQGIMHGIAKAFERWYCTDDATLTYIIRHHRLPDGHNRVMYQGKHKADAVRFWETIGMAPGEWNACFKTLDGKEIKTNALARKGIDGKPTLIDLDKNSGIYKPLREYGLIKE
jgi:hypothetical protein